MKIAIYHGLKLGGALLLTKKIQKFLCKNNIQIDIFSPNQNIRVMDNFIGELITVFYFLKNDDKKIANIINNNFDYAIVFPSQRIQFPNILRYLTIKNLYMYQESRREFFEKTSFDHFSIKRSLLRLLRSPICLLDYFNSKFIKKCITNSYYTKYTAKKIYGLNSIAILPGLLRIKPKLKKIKVPNKTISIGPFIFTKGHDFSFFQINNIYKSMYLIGNINIKDVYKFINKFSLKIKIKIIHNPKSIFKILKSFSKNSIFLANNNQEPFGLGTLDATTSELFVLGKNTGGTPEIISSGNNGLLYPNNIRTAKKLLKFIKKQKHITYCTNSKYNWSNYIDKLIYEITLHLASDPHPQQP